MKYLLIFLGLPIVNINMLSMHIIDINDRYNTHIHRLRLKLRLRLLRLRHPLKQRLRSPSLPPTLSISPTGLYHCGTLVSPFQHVWSYRIFSNAEMNMVECEEYNMEKIYGHDKIQYTFDHLQQLEIQVKRWRQEKLQQGQQT